ncbi:MAG: hypothetical protein G01um10148_338 [Parcubacteria group bacterium Gr01-1014_8]|nr:MAG: hypothetical protein G01um10148_338 [Parcubacteria group bacterium Gr01-1014_8]
MRKRDFFYIALLCFLPAAAFAVTMTVNTVVTGNVSVVGALSKGSGTFMIDHPLDPKNSLLYHSFLESPDVKNIYDGVANLDKNGEATIALPGYFLALNKDFRYLATSMSGPMPNLHLMRGVRREWFVGDPTFRIAGGVPGGTISWQVTGIRKDPLIVANPIIVEVEKGAEALILKGECLFELLCR